MNIMYRSTRREGGALTASQAILQGLAKDGGLFVPETCPKLDKSLMELSKMDYKGVAYEVMKLFLTDFTEEELRGCVEKAYDSKFDNETIAPLVFADNTYYMELFHGATIAFKDMALSILPHLMTTAAKKNNRKEEIVILTATSGDTGKAALAGFADVPGTRIIVFYPKNGVSRVQELQMVTQKGANTTVIGVTGNFDDCQTGVKKMFGDAALREAMAENGMTFSSANSINIGRLVPQVAYYVFAYTRLLAENRIADGEAVNFVVPTGNFGNILACYYAKKLGLPVAKMLCASNENKVLFDFFNTGCYDRRREFILTNSPSMDILISSNLERLIYHSCGDCAEKNAALMQQLSKDGFYEIDEAMKEEMKDFIPGFATEADTKEEIYELYDLTGYVIDTHTAVASHVYRNYRKETGDNTATVVVSTASPFKFSRSVMEAIHRNSDSRDDFEIISELSKVANVAEPPAIEEIRTAPVRHNIVCATAEMQKQVRKILGLPSTEE